MVSDNNLRFFLQLKNAAFGRTPGQCFRDFSWQIKTGETWAIAGPGGSGKSTLAEVLAGKVPLQAGLLEYDFHPGLNYEAQKQIGYLAFTPKNSRLNYAHYYYQQRFNSSDADGQPTVADFLGIGPKEPHETLPAFLGLAELLPLEIIKLSNGQTRKMLLARALLEHPRLLILDMPFLGLDTGSREHLHQTIRNLIATGLQVILITNQEEIPDWVSHVLLVREFKSAGTFTREDFSNLNAQQKATISPEKNQLPFHLFDRDPQRVPVQVMVRLEKATVQYDGKKVVDGIDWDIRAGEKWALTGPNGSGKTTLLSLVNGDNPQAFANRITLFDRRKGSGESIWDIKRRIGFVSPELHLYFRQSMPAWKVAGTGFTDTLFLSRLLTVAENQKVRDFFTYFDLTHLLVRSFLQLSSGEQRVVLIIRSLLKNPDLLIWDEPFQGLSPEVVETTQNLLRAYISPENAVILVTHFAEEIPDWVTHTLELRNGKQVPPPVQPINKEC